MTQADAISLGTNPTFIVRVAVRKSSAPRTKLNLSTFLLARTFTMSVKSTMADASETAMYASPK
jgi:hypothetical protein